MNLPVDFVKQTYDSLKQKDYALSDDFLVKKIYEIIKILSNNIIIFLKIIISILFNYNL